MADQVKVTSIGALEAFRANLIIFINKAHNSVDEVGDEVRRTRQWLQNDQRMHWEGELRRRQKIFNEAKQVLLSARMSGLKSSTSEQEAAVAKAKRAFHEAEEKLANVKRWARNYDNAVDPLIKGLDGVRYALDHDLPKALAYLVQAQRTLETYAETNAASAGLEKPAPAEATPEEHQ
jgi:hypothetical protein